MCTVKLYYILFERLELFAIRLPSLSRGNELLGCGITFDIFTHVLCGSFLSLIFYFIIYNIKKRKKIHGDDLDGGYKVVSLQKETMHIKHF